MLGFLVRASRPPSLEIPFLVMSYAAVAFVVVLVASGIYGAIAATVRNERAQRRSSAWDAAAAALARPSHAPGK